MRQNYLIGLLVLLALAACNSTPPPPQPTPAPAVEVPQTPTVALPAASAASPTPTQGPPTPTATRVVRSSATPTAPPPLPSPTPVVYVVEQYDTLFGIALEFGLTVDALATANGISENDFLQIGQSLLIPAADGETPASPPDPVDAPATVEESTQPNAGGVENPDAPAETGATEAGTAANQADAGAATQPPAAQPLAPPTPVPNLPAPPPVNRAANINPLTGLPVANPAQLQRRPLLVRIGNDAGARASQAGLNRADMVYEEITEWWVTRFTAIFLAETPTTVAPIRSARLINVQLVPQYQGALAHSGGSDPVRWEISQSPIVNLDEFYSPLPYYYRPNEGWQTRLAVDAEAARDYMVSQGTEAAVSLHGFVFNNAITTGEPAENIYIPYPRATTFTQWIYNAASGKYRRWANGEPLYDANGLGQVAASNVIIYFAEHQPTDIVEDSNGATSIRIMMNGQGVAWFFRDGKLNKGIWQTDGTRTPYFAYEDGSPFPLKPGNTWVQVVPTYFTIGLNSPDEASARP